MTTPNNRLYGFYRAKVVNNKDPDKYGRIILWIPVTMPEISEDKGIWARPANNSVGGRNMEELSDQHFMGSSFIPKKGSWVLIFFDDGNINKPYYVCGLDIENTKVLPENQLGSNYEHKWTIFKSHEGRTIHISDDPEDQRVEITGKKRQLTINDASGDTESVYPIIFNQNTILLDERDGKEKLLIQTYKGDYIHVDIDSRKLQCKFESDIIIESGASIHITAKDNIRIEAGDEMYQESVRGPTYRKAKMNIHDETEAAYHSKSKKVTNIESTTSNINIKASKVINQESGTDFNIKSGAILNQESTATFNIKSGAILNQESTAAFNIKSGALLNLQSTAALNIKSGALLNLQSVGILNIKAGGPLQASATAVNILSTSTVAITGAVGGMSASASGMEMECTGDMSLKATGSISLDGSLTNEQCGLAGPATPATSSDPADSADSADPADSAIEATESKPAEPTKPVGGRDI